MIALTRERTPAAVPSDFYGEKRIAHNLELIKGVIASGDKKFSDWNSAIWGRAKAQLLKESNGKCAYCESPTTVVSYGDVEHFRPKSLYWWLAYCYENYLPSCTICNQRYKRDDFPISPRGYAWKAPVLKPGMTDEVLQELAAKMTCDALQDAEGMPMKTFESKMRHESALLIHPYFQEPEYYLAYQALPQTKEVIVVPRRKTAKAIVEACEQYFGINRQELRDERYRYYSIYVTYRQVVAAGLPGKEALLQNILDRINEMKSGKLRYTGMIRYFETKELKELAWDLPL